MRRKKSLGLAAHSALIETLEQRQLLHDGVTLHVAFAPPSTPIPEPYDHDAGKVYSAQDDGVLYGWDSDNTANVHERHDGAAPDILHSGYAILPPAGKNAFEIQVPDDDYQVHVVAGDSQTTNTHYRINVEGVMTVDGTATAKNPWVEGTQIVTVRDGKLTISSAAGAGTNKIDYIDIVPWDNATTVSVAPAPQASSSAPHGGGFVFTRVGSVTDAATYDYLVGGSASSGHDYAPLSGIVFFSPGASSVTVPVTPNLDKLSGTKTVMATLVSEPDFLIGNLSATTTIAGIPPIHLLSSASSFSTARINFQPASDSTVPDYYHADTGAVYGVRSNGMTYGWSVDNTANMRVRDSSLSPDARYDTLAATQKSGSNSWSIAVPNGTYTVRVVSGDAGFTNDVFKINVNGVLTVNGTPTSAQHWVEGTKTVTVTNGKITLSSASGSVNNDIDFVEIAAGSHPIPVVSVAASGSPAEGSASGKFTFTRTGDLSQALTVTYTLGGTATNGSDYTALPGAITIPAGSASASATLHPIDDSIAEGNESVVLTISTSSKYSNGQIETASRTIADNDISTATGKLTFKTGASDPLARSEAMGATVNGNVYAFGGYIDTTYHPVATVNVYNIASNKWTTIANMPFGGLTHAGTTVDGSDVYLAGGYPASATKGQTFSTTNVWQFNTTNDTWKAMPALPAGRGAGTMVNLNHVLYFFGGADPNRKDVSTMWKLDLNNTAAGWQAVANMPAPRNHVGGVALDGDIYAVGGQTGQDNLSVFKGDVWKYDPTTNKWTTEASLPGQPRSHIAAATFVYNGMIIAEGGEGPGRVALNYVQEYNPATNVWSSLTPLPQGRSSGIGQNLGNGEILYTSGYDGFFANQTWIGTFT